MSAPAVRGDGTDGPFGGVTPDQTLLLALAQGVQDALIIISPAGIVEVWNPAAARLFGYTAEEARGAHFAALLWPPGEEGQAPRDTDTLIARGTQGRWQTILRTAADVHGHLLCSLCSVALSAGAGASCLLLIHDLTLEQTIRTHLALITDALAAAHDQEQGHAQAVAAGERREEALLHLLTEREERARERDAFLDMVGHELRTPVTAAHGFVQLLEKKVAADAPHLLSTVEAARRGTTRLAAIAEDLVDLALIQQRRLDLLYEPLDLSLLLPALAVDQTIVFERDIVLPVPPHPPCLITADRACVEQIVHHLLRNAVSYSAQGTPVALVWGQTADHAAVLVHVSDQVPGEPATPAPSPLSGVADHHDARPLLAQIQQSGRGLGLYLARTLAALHGGEVTFLSADTQGATFQLMLPTSPLTEGPGEMEQDWYAEIDRDGRRPVSTL